MPYVQGLLVLNDCVENQKIARKLSDWLSSRWNVTIYQDEHKMFPNFGYFIRFLIRFLNISQSLLAIKPTEWENSKEQQIC